MMSYSFISIPRLGWPEPLPHSIRLDNLDPTIHLACACLGGWRKPVYPEKSHAAWGAQAHSTQTVAPTGNQFYFFINVIQEALVNEMRA